MFKSKKEPTPFYWTLGIIGAIAGAVLLFAFWGLEWYQENELELEYGILNIAFLIIHLIPFLISVVGGGLAGFFGGGLAALIIDSIIAKLRASEVDASGRKKILTKPRKVLLVIVAIVMTIPVIFIISRITEKQKIRSEITNYLSTEFGLEDIKIKFTEPYSDTMKYGVEVYSSNLDSLSYEKMTRIEGYLTSHTELDFGDVDIARYLCGDDTYIIYPSSVYKNGVCVYEYKEAPSSSIISADVPYIGMNAEFIGRTKLGSPDDTELCRDYYALRPERRSITYRWYDSKGKVMFTAYAINGKVTSVVDFRK